MSYPVPPKTLILHDGGMGALLACGIASEAALLGAGASGTSPEVGAVLFGASTAGTRDRAAAVLKQCEKLGVTVHEMKPLPVGGAGPKQEVLELVHTTYAAAALGYERVLWPATGTLGDSIDLDRVAQIADRGLLVGRLVALDAREHGVPSIRVETPWADFTDRQVADLVCDMELPVEACWFWGVEADAEAERERRRWESALGAGGWSRS